MNNDFSETIVRLCVEICSPLSESELAYVLSLAYPGRQEGIPSFSLEASQHHTLEELKSEFDACAELRTLCAALAHYRLENETTQYHPADQRYGFQARYAILRGESAGMAKALAAYKRSVPPIGMSPELTHEGFWNAVLGKEWTGCKLVPPGVAKREITVMYALRRALFSAPEVSMEALCTIAPDLMMGYAFLRLDCSISTLPPASLPPSVHELVRAYWFFRIGKWGDALNELKTYFESQKTEREAVKSPGNALLLLVALILAIHQNLPHQEVRSLRNTASELLLRVLPSADGAQQHEVAELFNALDVWDAVSNRSVTSVAPLALHDDLPLVALGIGAHVIANRTSMSLPLEKMVAAVEAVENRGVSMLSMFAAASLLQLPELSAHMRQQMNAIILKHKNFVPLYPVDGEAASAEEGKSRLHMLLEEQAKEQEKWLYWDLSFNHSMELCSITPRLVQKKPQSTGSELSPQQVLDPSLVNSQDERDVAMVGLAGLAPSLLSNGQVPLLADVLAGHPRLRWVQESYRRLVRVRKVRPVIHVERSATHLMLTLDTRQFIRFRQMDKGELALPAYPSRMQVIVDYFQNNTVRVNLRDTGEVRWILSTLAQCFELEGNVPETLRENTPSLGELHVRITRLRQGYGVELLVRHHAEVAVFSTPGVGDELMLVDTPKQGAVCVSRDREHEVQAASMLATATPELRQLTPLSDFHWKASDEVPLLHALHALRDKVGFSWADGEEEHPHLLEAAPLRITLLRSSGEWLEIGAELEVNEGNVLVLSKLLEAYRARMDDVLPLGSNRYLIATPELLAQLEGLNSVIRHRGRKLGMPLAALPSLAVSWPAPLPDFIRRSAEQMHECDDAPVPAELTATLRDYQVQGYRWMLARVQAGLGACLADDMGLGKTVQLLAVLLRCASAGPSLVVTPLSLCANWETEASRFAPSLRVVRYGMRLHSELPTLQAGDLVVASYGQVVAGEDAFTAVQWNVVALDEAQSIKNPDSRRAEVVCMLRSKARLCLTGTPVENSLRDLWSIMRFLNPYLLDSHHVGRTAAEVSSMQRLVAPLVLRRTKQEVLPQLPPMTEVVIGVELSSSERELYESVRRHAIESVKEGQGATVLLAELMRLRRLCCHGKLAWDGYEGASSKLSRMVSLVLSLQTAGHRALVFSQFTDVLDLAQTALNKVGTSTLRLDGRMRVKERLAAVEAFQRGEGQVFLISLRAGGSGLNLTAADYIILLDPWWNPAVEAQAAGRSHRLGQSQPVTLCRLITRNTVEERVLQMHETKLELAESVIRNNASMSLDSLRNILLNS